MKKALYIDRLFKLLLDTGIPNGIGGNYSFECTVGTIEQARAIVREMGWDVEIEVPVPPTRGWGAPLPQDENDAEWIEGRK